MTWVSVVVPAYKGERFIADAVRSVRSQTLCEWELIVVDDGSPDDSAKVARQAAQDDARIRVVHKDNGGVATARNHGFTESDRRAPYILFLDQDDRLLPGALHALVKALNDSANVVASHGRMTGLDADGHIYPTAESLYLSDRWGPSLLRPVRWPKHRSTTLGVLMLMNVMRTPGLTLMRKDTLRRIGLFDQSLAPADDLDMALRLAMAGPIAYVDRVVLCYRMHDANVTLTHGLLTDDATVRAYKKALSSPTLSYAQREEARRAYMWQGKHVDRYIFWRYILWTRENIRNGDLLPAAKQIRHAAMAKVHYLRAFPGLPWSLDLPNAPSIMEDRIV